MIKYVLKYLLFWWCYLNLGFHCSGAILEYCDFYLVVLWTRCIRIYLDCDWVNLFNLTGHNLMILLKLIIIIIKLYWYLNRMINIFDSLYKIILSGLSLHLIMEYAITISTARYNSFPYWFLQKTHTLCKIFLCPESKFTLEKIMFETLQKRYVLSYLLSVLNTAEIIHQYLL